MSEEINDTEEVDPFEWTTEMEFHYNMVEVACSGLAAMEGINDMTKKDTALKNDLTTKCLAILQRSISFFDGLD